MGFFLPLPANGEESKYYLSGTKRMRGKGREGERGFDITFG